MTSDPTPAADGRPVVVISWIEHHNRSVWLAAALGGTAVFMPWAWPRQSVRRRVSGWIRSGWVTARRVRSVPRGGLVIVMAPPVFAPLTAWLSRRRGTAMAVDVHSGALNDPRWRWALPLMRTLLRSSDAVIVTNEEVLAGTETGSAAIVVLHDPVVTRPDITHTPRPTPNWRYAVFPSSGAEDEPFEAVAQAAEELGDECEIVVTGRAPAWLASTAVRLTGFLPTEEYDEIVRDADVVLALTTREATMQLAAYEALSWARPIVCSDTRVLRATFDGAAEFAASDGASLAAAIRAANSRADQLQANGRLVLQRLQVEAQASLAVLRTLTPRRGD